MTHLTGDIPDSELKTREIRFVTDFMVKKANNEGSESPTAQVSNDRLHVDWMTH